MEACTSTRGLLTYSLTQLLICPSNALVSHLKLVPGFWACLLFIDNCLKYLYTVLPLRMFGW